MAVVDSAGAGIRAAARGATLLQLRMPGAAGGVLEREAAELVRAVELPVVVSSRADVALAVGAAGVHLPETDVPAGEARRLLGRDRLVGRSVHSVAAARLAEAEGADYAVFGPVNPTPSHPGRAGAGLTALSEVCASVRIPVLAIGGVDAATAEACAAAGAAGWASIRAFA